MCQSLGRELTKETGTSVVQTLQLTVRPSLTARGVSFEQKHLCSVQHESIIWMSAILCVRENGGACGRGLPTRLTQAVPLACNRPSVCPFVETGACAMCALLECCVQFCLVFVPAPQAGNKAFFFPRVLLLFSVGHICRGFLQAWQMRPRGASKLAPAALAGIVCPLATELAAVIVRVIQCR